MNWRTEGLPSASGKGIVPVTLNVHQKGFDCVFSDLIITRGSLVDGKELNPSCHLYPKVKLRVILGTINTIKNQ